MGGVAHMLAFLVYSDAPLALAPPPSQQRGEHYRGLTQDSQTVLQYQLRDKNMEAEEVKK